MALGRPFNVNLYWGCNIESENGFIKGDKSTLTTSIVVRRKVRYEEFIDLVYAHVGVERASILGKYCTILPISYLKLITLTRSDKSLDATYFLAEKDENYWGQVRVEVEKISHGQPKDLGTVDILGKFRGSVQTHDDVIRVNEMQVNEGNSESLSNVEDASKHNVKSIQLLDAGGETGNDGMAGFEDDVNSDIWSVSINKIRVGMQFESMLQVCSKNQSSIRSEHGIKGTFVWEEMREGTIKSRHQDLSWFGYEALLRPTPLPECPTRDFTMSTNSL
nr:hypothetical protein [Tanacetum cinerariifolium]